MKTSEQMLLLVEKLNSFIIIKETPMNFEKTKIKAGKTTENSNFRSGCKRNGKEVVI
jgi:hypothetical protein